MYRPVGSDVLICLGFGPDGEDMGKCFVSAPTYSLMISSKLFLQFSFRSSVLSELPLFPLCVCVCVEYKIGIVKEKRQMHG